MIDMGAFEAIESRASIQGIQGRNDRMALLDFAVRVKECM
jgi:hypothetical protein